MRLITDYPEFKALYEDVYHLCLNMEKVMGMFSQELRILDVNTTQLMIDMMQEQLEKKKVEAEETQAELEKVQAEAEETQAELEKVQAEAEEAQAELEKVQAEAEEAQAEKKELEEKLIERDELIRALRGKIEKAGI